jgi:hypothetical protein
VAPRLQVEVLAGGLQTVGVGLAIGHIPQTVSAQLRAAMVSPFLTEEYFLFGSGNFGIE